MGGDDHSENPDRDPFDDADRDTDGDDREPDDTDPSDLHSERSMEDILSSIRRVIAREDEERGPRRRATDALGNPLGGVPVDDSTGALDLTSVLETEADAASADKATDPPPPLGVATEHSPPAPARKPTPRPTARPAPAAPPARQGPMLSPDAKRASREKISSLETLVDRGSPASAQRAPGGARTIDDLVKEALRPMLQQWLDAHLPAVVDRLVQREIERITREDED